MCWRQSLWFISLGWVKIIPNTSCLHPLGTKGEEEGGLEVWFWRHDGLRPRTTSPVHVKTTSSFTHFSPLQGGTPTWPREQWCFWACRAPQPGAPQVREHMLLLGTPRLPQIIGNHNFADFINALKDCHSIVCCGTTSLILWEKDTVCILSKILIHESSGFNTKQMSCCLLV